MIQSGNEVAADSKLCKRSRTLNTKPDQPEIFAELFDQLPDEKFAKPQLGVEHESNVDVAAAFSSALAEPFLYPPLDQSVFPGDDIAIVLQSDLPHAKLALQSLLDQLYSLKMNLLTLRLSLPPVRQLNLRSIQSLSNRKKSNLPKGRSREPSRTTLEKKRSTSRFTTPKTRRDILTWPPMPTLCQSM